MTANPPDPPAPRFSTLPPPAPLAPFVAMLWDWEATPAAFRLERILPQPGPSLIVNLAEDETRVYDEEKRCERLSGSALDGPVSRSFLIDTHEQTAVVGAVFHVGGAWPFFGESQHRLADRHADIDALLGRHVDHLRERLLDATHAHARLRILAGWLLARCRRHALHPGVRGALAQLDRGSRVRDAARAAGVSERRLGALFAEQVGLSPKRYARLQRFRRLLALVHPKASIDWAGEAADAGYHDQAHLVREFRDFSGLTPTAWLRLRGPHVNHVAVATSASHAVEPSRDEDRAPALEL